MKIIPRSGWGARAPKSRTTTTWSKRTKVAIHWSAGPASQTPREIQDFHMAAPPRGRGWADVGYNFLVSRDGRIYEGRGWTVVGAHAAGHNTEAIGICLIGRTGSDLTPAAKRAIRWLFDEACRRAGRRLAVCGHRDLGSTQCPGDTVYAWIKAGMPVDQLNQPSGGSSGSTESTPNWTEEIIMALPSLARGAKGADVGRLQGLLHAAGYRDSAIDNNFGAKTERAVQRFQQHKKVKGSVRSDGTGDGVCGRYTWAALLGE